MLREKSWYLQLQMVLAINNAKDHKVITTYINIDKLLCC